MELVKASRKELVRNREVIESSIRDTDAVLVRYASAVDDSSDSYRTARDTLAELRADLERDREILSSAIHDIEGIAAQYAPMKPAEVQIGTPLRQSFSRGRLLFGQ